MGSWPDARRDFSATSHSIVHPRNANLRGQIERRIGREKHERGGSEWKLDQSSGQGRGLSCARKFIRIVNARHRLYRFSTV
jgi:hypothetical protein